MREREELLRRLATLGFDTSQCQDMSDERLAGWIDECEIIAYRDQTGHLPPTGDHADATMFNPIRMEEAYRAARRLTDRYGDRASNMVMDEIIALAGQGNSDELRRCGAILQALRDLEAAKTCRH